MMITRRRLFAFAALGQPRPDSMRSGAADPLQNPDWVGGTRRVVGVLQNDPTVVAAERQLRCSCPCGLDIFTCRTTDFACTYSPALHDEVVALVAEGKTTEQVVAAFLAKYGEQALLAPKAQGLGVLGYLLPGAAILAVGAALVWVIRRRRAEPAPAAFPGAAHPDDLSRLDRALKDIEA